MTGAISRSDALISVAGLSVPLAGAYLAEFALLFTDLIILGRLGATELAAASLTCDVLFSLMMLPIGIVNVVAVLVAEAMGGGRRAEAAMAIRTVLLLSLVLSLPMIAAALLLPALFAAFGQGEAVVALSQSFVLGIVGSIPATLAFTALRQAMAAAGTAGGSTAIILGAIALNAVLDLILVFEGPGRFGLGVLGAALATTIVSWASLLVLLALFARRHPDLYQMLRSPAGLRPRLRPFLILGVPSGLAALFEYGGFIVIALMIGGLGVAALAANQIAFNFAFLVSMICYGIGDAGMIRASQLRGAGGIDAYRAERAALQLGLLVVTVIAGFTLLFPRAVLSIFISIEDADNAATVAIAMTILGAMALFQCLEGLQAILNRLLKGRGEVGTAFWSSAVGYWLFGVAGGFVALHALSGTATSVWLALTAGLGLMFVAQAARYYRLRQAEAIACSRVPAA